MDGLFHIVDRDAWSRAVAAGEYRPSSLQTEGFVHLSFTDQVAAVADKLYRDDENLCVVEFDPARLAAEIRVEDSYGSGTAYPHHYGPLPSAAAVAVHELTRLPDCDYAFTPRRASGAASSDR